MKIHHIAICVASLEKSKDFYSQLLAFRPVKKFERKDLGARAVMLKGNNIILELWVFRQKKKQKDIEMLNTLGIRHIAFAIKGLEKTVEKYKQAGLKFSPIKLGASGHRYTFTKDPDNIPIEFYEI